jgi:plasmid stabilization system protein ParE
MATYRLSQRTRRDLVEIWSYIAEDNEAAADRFINLLMGSFRRLG